MTPIPDKLPIPGPEGHKPGKQEASQTGIGRRFRIGDHEKGKQHQRTILQLVQGNAQGITEPEGTAKA
jgi:hypothetical protein